MPENFSAVLDPAGANRDVWLKILGSDRVPLKSAVSHKTDLGSERGVDVYELNLKAMTLMQRRRLAEWFSQTLGKSVNQIEAEFDNWDVSIRASDVIVSISARAFV